MKKSTKKKKSAYIEVALKASPSLSLVVIDQKPIRNKFILSCKKTIKELDKVRNEWIHFENTDLPRYTQWYNKTFGDELSEIKDAYHKAGDAYSLIQEIEDLKFKYRISYYDAYKLALDRRKNPEKYEAESEFEDEDDEFDEDEPNYKDENHDNFGDEEILKVFKEFLKTNPQLQEIAKDKKAFQILFEKFKFQFNRKKEEQKAREAEQKELKKVNPNIIDRVKSVYRALVRKLHPDYRKESGEHFETLWFEVQEAYRSNNLEKLEILHSQFNAYEGNFSEEFSIFQIKSAKDGYSLQLKSIRSKIKLAKKDPAWGFSKQGNKEVSLKSKEIKNQLKRELVEHKENLVQFNEILRRWSTPPNRTNKVKNTYIEFGDDDYISYLF
jgi:hypothetical protein